MDANHRKKLFGYSSLFITLVLNTPKLLALRRDGIIARLWHFDGFELCFQTFITFFFCIAVFYFNKDRGRVFIHPGAWREKSGLLLQNAGIMAAFILFGETIQHLFFQRGAFPTGGYGFRFIVSLLLAGIELRIYFLLQETREKEFENEHLRNAWLQSQLTLLKGQLNPHFLFNSLSSLSAIVRENPRLAQRYIAHLSKIFRYSLQQASTDFVPLSDELAVVRSYAELMKMRYEEGFQLTMPSGEMASGRSILPMSLQLLVENALKHNTASATHPLSIVISLIEPGAVLRICNNLQPLHIPEPGTGIGLSNLNERYRILLQQDINITTTESEFIVQLPLVVS